MPVRLREQASALALWLALTSRRASWSISQSEVRAALTTSVGDVSGCSADLRDYGAPARALVRQ
jgi:hypothetical protein